MNPPIRLRSRIPVWDTVLSPHRLSLGLRRLGPGERWLDVDEDLEEDLAEKERLFRVRGPDVFVELPESRAAQDEVLDLVVHSLLAEYPDCYSKTGRRLKIVPTGKELDLRDPSRSPLELASLCVQEDLVVMQSRPDGWCLTAAAVCFPTRWALRPQLGRAMTQIHERVPGYVEALDESSNRFFDGMKSGEVYGRGNWSLLDDPTLHQPTGKMQSHRNPKLDRTNAGDQIWLRVEHQTLQRLPSSDSILFGIRIHRTPLRDVAEDVLASRTLIEAIDTMASAMQRYKSLGRVREVATSYLEDAIAEHEKIGADPHRPA